MVLEDHLILEGLVDHPILEEQEVLPILEVLEDLVEVVL